MSFEQDLLTIINQHVGQAHAVSVDTLCYYLSAEQPWEIRQAIHDLRERGELIASSGNGYYRPCSLREALEYVDNQFRNPARSELRLARVQRERAFRFFGGQMEMFSK